MKPTAGREPGARFCTGCGAGLATNARFCADCGQAVGAAPAAAPSLRHQLPGLIVLAFFLVAGLVVWVGVLQPGTPTSSAPGRGGPGRGGPVASGGAGGDEMPPNHPPIGLPNEAKKFVAQLAEKAAAAPSDVAAWKSLAQAQSQAAEMEPSYGDQALDSWKHVLSLAPEDAEAVRGIGNVYYDQQKFAAAAEQYEQYLKTHGDDASVRTDLATAYLYQRQFDKAVATYLETLAASPEFLQAHFNLGLAYEAMGDRKKAMASLDKARALATDDETRTRIDGVKTQLAATPAGAAAASITDAGNAPNAGTAGGSPPPGMAPPGSPPPGPATAGNAPAPSGADFPSQVEAQLRANKILGPKIRSIEWPEPSRARVLIADFPMQNMPDFARNIFRAHLETILHDAKEKFSITEPRTIELVDAADGTTMDTVAH